MFGFSSVLATDAPARAAAPSTPRQSQPRTLLVLGVFFVSLYVLTSAGHLDSPDEELMFQATRSLVERGTLDVGDASSPERLAFPGVDGRTYAPYGPVSSALSVPFYVLGAGLGEIAGPRYVEVLERFAVGLRDAFVSAAVCLVFYAVAIELGYRVRTTVLLTLAFGTATLIWPYAKYSWSEPVTALGLLGAVYAAMRAARCRSVAWSAVCGIAIGLAIGSKVATAVVVPGLFVYLLWRGGKVAWPFAAIMLLPALGVAALDVVKYGNPLDTGYHLDGLIDLSRPIGIAGLLFSPGKSVFLYAPVALLGVYGLTRLTRPEAALFGFLVLSHVLLYGSLAIWAGDAAWGPRYLVPVVAFLVLPAGALVQRHYKTFGALVAAGLIVNVAGVLLDQRVYYVDLLGTAERDAGRIEGLRWDVRMSPPLVHWRLLGRRWWMLLRDPSPAVAIESGTYESEGGLSDGFPAWTNGDAVLRVRGNGQPVRLQFRYRDTRPSGDANVQVVVDGANVQPTNKTRVDISDPQNARVWDVTVELPPSQQPRTVEVTSTTYLPARDAPPSQDIRPLGIDIVSMTAQLGGASITPTMDQFPPMPVSDTQPWTFLTSTWFWGTSTQLADVWEWYLLLSGLPRWLLLLALVPLGGLIWSTRRLRTALC